jgi:hypothetical protein
VLSVTSLASQGVSVFVLAELAGHKSISTTQRYVTVNADVKRRAVELVYSNTLLTCFKQSMRFCVLKATTAPQLRNKYVTKYFT